MLQDSIIKMNRQEVISLQNFRLKNQITDLRNALSMNRDFLVLLSKQQLTNQSKINLLYKIIIRLTQQSDEALLANLELIQQKDALKQQIYKLNKQLDRVQARFEAQLERNKVLENPSEGKIALQQQFHSLNNELLASQEERITLEEEIRFWKRQYSNLEGQLRESTQAEDFSLETQGRQGKTFKAVKHKSELAENTRCKIKRKYTSNARLIDFRKHQSRQRQVRHLKQYIQELEARLQIFIKAYNYQQNVLQRKATIKGKIHPLNNRLDREITLLKYAMNDIKVYMRNDEKFMFIRHNFRENEHSNDSFNRQARSWPKHKEWRFDSDIGDNISVGPDLNMKRY